MTQEEVITTDLIARMEADHLDYMRVCWPDQHGLSRSKTVSRAEFARSLEHGRGVQMATLVLDSGNFPFVNPFADAAPLGVAELAGMPSGLARPDPATFRLLPWADRTGWVLCDTFLPSGAPVPLDTRAALRRVVDRLEAKGLQLMIGLELEFYVFRLEDDGLEAAKHPATPRISMASHGFQAYSEERFDRLEPLVRRIGDALGAAGAPPATLEFEWGPGQVELTMAPMPVMEAADTLLFVKGAIKQVCRRAGYLASFMALPKIANAVASGWHIHQSLCDTEGATRMVSGEGAARTLSAEASCWIAGILANGPATSLLTAPTVNGYKRYRPNSFAPVRACWGFNNRSAMIRALMDGPATRIENRVAEPAANPYLALSAQIIAGLDGVERRLDPGAAVLDGYASDAPALPTDLGAAIEAFRASEVLRNALGPVLHDYLAALKTAEWRRFLSAVTDWEEAEYLDTF